VAEVRNNGQFCDRADKTCSGEALKDPKMDQQELSASLFGSHAANYLTSPTHATGADLERLSALARTLAPARALDVGCGAGHASFALARGGVPRVIACDPSAEMLAAGQRSAPTATFVEGRVEQLPFADNSFDAATVAQSFHWFVADLAFAELMRVVKPGGSIAVWWKVLGSDDPMRAVRKAACAKAGVTDTKDPMQGGFNAFYRAPFATRALRVLPFTGRFTVMDWIGYERSRATARDAFGAKHDAYIAALYEELLAKFGSPQAKISVRYTQYLYVGNIAKA